MHVTAIVSTKRPRVCVHETFNRRWRVTPLHVTQPEVWTAATTARSCVSGGRRVRQGLEVTSSSPLSNVQFRVEDQWGGGVQWRPWGGCMRVGSGRGAEEVERVQFTVWLYPLFSEWSAAARGPAWSRRSPWSVVAPAPSSLLSPWPVWPAAPLF